MTSRTSFTSEDQAFMGEAIRQAQIAFDKDEVPVGAVIVHNKRIIARAHNQVEMLKDPTAHAEIIAITQAASTLSCKWLNECVAYVTIEPCSMCAGAFVLARIKTLYFGAKDPKTGACGSCFNIVNNAKMNHKIKVFGGLFKDECGQLMSDFFAKKRKESTALN
jgi:tRNA(adenine34) deaminase